MRVVPRQSGQSWEFVSFDPQTLVLSVSSTSEADIGTFEVLITGTIDQIHTKSMTCTLTVSETELCDSKRSQLTEGLLQADLVY
jgi:hypothetical protein